MKLYKHKVYLLTIFLILLFAFFLRIMCVDYNRTIPIGGDESAYDYAAKNIIKYSCFTNDRYGEIYRGEKDIVPTTSIQIGYPIYISFFYLFSNSTKIIFISQCILSMITILLVWRILENIKLNKKIIVLIILLFSIYPGNIYNINRLLTETLFTTLFTAFIYFYLYWIEHSQNHIYLFLASLFLTCSIFIRGTALPFLFLCCLHILIYYKKRIKNIIYLLLPFFILELPWILRNYAIMQKICILSEAGENPKIWGAMPYYLDMASSTGYTFSQLISNDLFINKFLFFRWRLFGFLQYMWGDIWDENMRHSSLGSLLFIQYFIIFALILIPILVKSKDKKMLFIAAIPLGWILLIMPYHALPRYVFPIIPIIFVLLGKELNIIYDIIKRNDGIYNYTSKIEKVLWKIFIVYSVIFSILLFISIFIFSNFINFEISEWRLNKYYNTSINEIKYTMDKKYITYNSLDNMQLENMIHIKNNKFKSTSTASPIIEIPINLYSSKIDKIVTKVDINIRGGYLYDKMTVYWKDETDSLNVPRFNENKVYQFPINIFQTNHTIYIDGDVSSLIIVPSMFANNTFDISSIDVTKYNLE